jgi:hypothetical protein
VLPSTAQRLGGLVHKPGRPAWGGLFMEVVPMSDATIRHTSLLPIEHLHTAFLSILPRIELYAQVYFRHVRCPQSRDDAIGETIALSWRWFLRLLEQGKDPLTFVSRIADFATRHVRSGRRLCGQEKDKDVLSGVAQHRHRFAVGSLPSSNATTHEALYGTVGGQRKLDAFEERLQDNIQTPVPEQVCFRMDFPAWLETLTPRERRMIREMANNERTLDLSKRFEVSPGRISQMRSELRNDWARFCGDVVGA